MRRPGVLEVHHQLAILDPPAAEEFARAHLPALATDEEWPKASGSASQRRVTGGGGLALAPTPGDSLYEIAVIYHKQGEDDRAVAAFEEAGRFESRHAKAWYGLAQAAAMAGDTTAVVDEVSRKAIVTAANGSGKRSPLGNSCDSGGSY